MAYKWQSVLSTSIIFYVNFFVLVNSDVVPVIIWGQDGIDSVPSARNGHTVSQQAFADDYLNKLMHSEGGHNLLIFLQDKLGVEDFTQNADVYNKNTNGGSMKNIKQLMNAAPSVELPRVESPAASVDVLKNKFTGRTHEIRDAASLSSLALENDGSNLVIAHLLSSDMQKNDEMIGEVSSKLAALSKPYVALYTGAKSSKTETRPAISGRHLLASNDSAPQVFSVPPCILFYARTINITIGTKTYQLGLGTSDGTCNPDVLKMNFDDDGNTLQMTIEFNKTSTGDWKVTSWVLNSYSFESVTGQNINISTEGYLWAPSGFSYHCFEQPPLSGSNDNDTVKITLLQFQIQGLKVKDQKFGYPNDCIGFFTIPIWSGLIATLLLLSVLTFGILMLANINTMDRFDDPKGKAITVNAAD